MHVDVSDPVVAKDMIFKWIREEGVSIIQSRFEPGATGYFSGIKRNSFEELIWILLLFKKIFVTIISTF